MIASARVAWLAQRAADYGVQTGQVSIDFRKVRERKRSIVESFRRGSERRLEDHENVELVRGEASFVDARTVEVRRPDGDLRRLSASQVFINTGLRPARPPIDGLDDVPTFDNASIMELDEAPRHLLVLGGGYVGLEFAQMFRRFGSDVTVLDRGEHVLSNEDPDVAGAVQQILRDDGVTILSRASVARAEGAPSGGVRLIVEMPGGVQHVEGSHLLVAAGRVPNTDALGLAAAGVETDDKGFIRVNERLETSVPGVFALGDVKGGPAFTHVSYNDYMILRTNLLERGGATTAGRPLLYAVFIDPELGRVGLTEREARGQGRNVRVAKLPMNHVARALEMDETRGLMKAVVDADDDQILGCAILGVHGGEVMSVVQVAMAARLPWTALRDGMFAHPLFAEALNSLFASFEEEPPE